MLSGRLVSSSLGTSTLGETLLRQWQVRQPRDQQSASKTEPHLIRFIITWAPGVPASKAHPFSNK